MLSIFLTTAQCTVLQHVEKIKRFTGLPCFRGKSLCSVYSSTPSTLSLSSTSVWCALTPLFCLLAASFQLIYIRECISPPGFDALGDLLKPTIPTHTAPHPPPPQMVIHPGGKLLANDLDSSLANLVGSECPDPSAQQGGKKH